MENDILKRPIRESIFSMIAPASFGMLLTFLFQLVDTYFIGKLGSTELAAIGFAYPIYLLIVSLFMGIAAGISSAVGKSLGERNPEKARSLTTISQFAFMLLTLGIGVLGFYTISAVFSALGAEETTLHLITDYMEIIYIGMFALVGTLAGNAALMAKGIMVQSTIVMAIGGICNLLLDYLLIFGVGPFPRLELQGAALATAISWSVTLVLMTALLIKEKLWSFNSIFSLQRISSGLGEILMVGLPAVAAQVLNPIAITVITILVAKYGDKAVAAFGIAARIESLGLTGLLALSVILTPLVAQNFGAKIQERLDQLIVYSGKLNVYWSILFYLLLLALAGAMTSIFTADPEVIRYTRTYFRIVGISYAAFGLTLTTTSFFNGVYQPKSSLRITLIKSLMLTIPLTIVGSFFRLEGIWVGIALANFIGMFFADKALSKWLLTNNSDLYGVNRVQAYKDDFKLLKRQIFGKSQ